MRRRGAWRADVAEIDAGITRLEDELRDTRRELVRVTAQRDELRRVMGDIRRYAREEANRVTTDAVQQMIQKVRDQVKVGPPPATSDKIGTPTPSGPIHLAAHLQDPADPKHTGIH